MGMGVALLNTNGTVYLDRVTTTESFGGLMGTVQSFITDDQHVHAQLEPRKQMLDYSVICHSRVP